MKDYQKSNNEKQPNIKIHEEIQEVQTNKGPKMAKKPPMWLNDFIRSRRYILLRMRENIISKFYLILFLALLCLVVMLSYRVSGVICILLLYFVWHIRIVQNNLTL